MIKVSCNPLIMLILRIESQIHDTGMLEKLGYVYLRPKTTSEDIKRTQFIKNNTICNRTTEKKKVHIYLFHHGCFDVPRCNSITPDVVFSPLTCQIFCKLINCSYRKKSSGKDDGISPSYSLSTQML